MVKSVAASSAVIPLLKMKETDSLRNRQEGVVHELSSSIFELLCKVIVNKDKNVSTGFQAIQNNIVTAIDSGSFQTTLYGMAAQNNATLLLSVNVTAVDFTILSVFTSVPTFSPTIKPTSSAHNTLIQLATGSIAGIIIGALVVVVIIVAVVIMLCSKNKVSPTKQEK